jgi:hypothetical protein
MNCCSERGWQAQENSVYGFDALQGMAREEDFESKTSIRRAIPGRILVWMVPLMGQFRARHHTAPNHGEELALWARMTRL